MFYEVKKMSDQINLSEIDVTPVKPQNGLVAFASCVLNNHFYISSIAVHASPDGESFRLVYPAKILPNGKQVNCFNPITKRAGETLSCAIINAYKKLIMDIEAEKKSI
jgi:DNA-binding cell septation regulator SpoVG